MAEKQEEKQEFRRSLGLLDGRMVGGSGRLILLWILTYVCANIAYLNLLPLHGDPNATDIVGRGIMFADNDRVGTAATFQIFGNAAAAIMAGLIMVSTFGCNSGLILLGARVYYVMSDAGLFFKKASRIESFCRTWFCALDTVYLGKFALSIRHLWRFARLCDIRFVGLLLCHNYRCFRFAKKRTRSRATVSCTILSANTHHLHFDNNWNLPNFALH